MLTTLIIAPLLLSIVLLAVRSRTLNIAAVTAYAVLHLALSIGLWIRPGELAPYFRVDALNLPFLLILSLLNLGVSIYHGEFMNRSGLSLRWHTFYAVFLLLFVFAMSGVLLTTHLGLLWVFVEATTLASAPFIYYVGSKAALEATWKYIFICSVGIALALAGVVLLSMGCGPNVTLFFDDLGRHAASLDHFWLKLAFPFILVGFGTKAGLAPVHAWLPDAHAEAPSPVSAMLSGALLNTALLGILRTHRVMELAGLAKPANTILIAMGLLSLFVCAVFIARTGNYKRMLAYSSIEHMGLIALAVGVGGVARQGAILHAIAHSLTKAAFFLTAGNILHRYRTKEIGQVRDLLATDRATGWLWLLCLASILALPPFPMFWSEFLLASAMIANGTVWLLIITLALLTVIMYGMARSVLSMSFGSADRASGSATSITNIAPQALFLAVLLAIGLFLPPFLYRLIADAARLL